MSQNFGSLQWEAELREKFLAVNACSIRKEECSQINDLSFLSPYKARKRGAKLN